MTWEETVLWLRSQSELKGFVQQCYLDEPVTDAALRFSASEEWTESERLLKVCGGKVLEIGAGRGIASYAFAKAGCDVVALEPDPSPVTGCGAIETLNREAGVTIAIVREYAEKMQFRSAEFDIVYGRQVFHHVSSLPDVCKEIARVLKPGGRILIAREHVISKHSDLSVFLKNGITSSVYDGENARLLNEYESAFAEAELCLTCRLGPLDSVINYFPMNRLEWHAACIRDLIKIVGWKCGFALTDERNFLGRRLLAWYAARQSCLDQTPGRLFSFLAEKPVV